jgi:hypothetical protein
VFITFSSYWQSHTYTTHIGSCDKYLFLHKPPSVKSTHHSPPLSYQEDATEKYQFSNFSGSLYWHLCVPHFHFRVSRSSEMQFGVIYLKTWGDIQHSLHSRNMNFCFCLFLVEHTCHWIILYCISQCLLWLAVKMLKWGIVLMWGGSVCCDPHGPPVNLWTTDTVGWQTVQSVTVWSLCE